MPLRLHLTSLLFAAAAFGQMPEGIALPHAPAEKAEPLPPLGPVVPMTADEARDRTLGFVRDIDERLVAEAGRQLGEVSPETPPADRLSAVLRTLYLADGSTRTLVDAAAAEDWGGTEASLEGLNEDAFLNTNVRAFLARTLVAIGAYEEAREVLDGLSTDEAVDGPGLLFMRAVCEHAALEKEAGLRTIASLLDPASVVPERYAAVARLMRQDLEDLKDNDLNQISKQMRNVQRKLRRGKSGKPIQGEEQEIIEGLDKMIEGIEQQLKKMQGQGQMVPGNPLNPAEESQIGGPKGEGEVDKRPIGKSAGWGDLPPKARTEARNLIENQFPPHYRRAVEEYYKKLAERE